MNRSLQSRLGLGLLLSLIAAFLILGFFASISIRYLTEDFIYSRLSHDTETLLAALNKDTSQLEVASGRLAAVYQQPFSGHYYSITMGQQVARSRSLWDQSLKAPENREQNEVRYYQRGPQQQPLLMLYSRFVRNEQPIVIIVAEDLSPLNKSIHGFQVQFTVSMVGILAALVLLQTWVMRRGLKPLAQLQTDLKALENGQLNALTTSVPAELQPLVGEINQLNTELESRLKRHRNALSDLAHALKKPLTVVQQVAHDPRLDADIKEALLRQSSITQQLIHRILNRARLAGDVVSGKHFDFDSDLNELLATLNMIHRDKQLNFIKSVDTIEPCRFDREDMLELLGNLLDNACKWAKQQVHVSINQSPELTITIEDDGPGAPEESLNLINQRGVRLDESVEGHGMGLAIVNDIVSHFNGCMTSGKSEALGGLKIQIILP